MSTKEDNNRIDHREATGLASFHFEGYELVEKVVKQSGNSGRIYLPASWIGTKVKIIRLEPIGKKELE